jgi:hypothetical protein
MLRVVALRVEALRNDIWEASVHRTPIFAGALLLVLGVTGATAAGAQSTNQPAQQPATNSATPPERTIVCNRRHCRAIREGCRFVLAPHPRDNRIRCGGPRPA